MDQLQNIKVKQTEADLPALPHQTYKSITNVTAVNCCCKVPHVTSGRVSGSASDVRLSQKPDALLKNELLYIRFSKNCCNKKSCKKSYIIFFERPNTCMENPGCVFKAF